MEIEEQEKEEDWQDGDRDLSIREEVITAEHLEKAMTELESNLKANPVNKPFKKVVKVVRKDFLTGWPSMSNSWLPVATETVIARPIRT